MVKSVDDLLAERGTVKRPSRPYRATVGAGQAHVAELQALTAEHDQLLDEQEIASQGPRKAAEKQELPARVVEIRDRMGELLDLMAEYEGNITVTASMSDGEWAQWKIEHPARTGDEPGAREDFAGVCNITDLIEALPQFVTHWEDQPIPLEAFDALGLSLPDKRAIAAIVVALYEVGDNLPKLRSGWSALLASEPFSNLPEN